MHTDITVAYPWLDYIDIRKCCGGKVEKRSAHESLIYRINKKGKKINMDNTLADKDPIMKLGYGLTAYRNLMWAMICTFCVFTILQLPAFLIYRNGEGYQSANMALMGR
jgi:hypothetical protein